MDDTTTKKCDAPDCTEDATILMKIRSGGEATWRSACRRHVMTVVGHGSIVETRSPLLTPEQRRVKPHHD